jgi:Uncharacterized protein conserved in bacteria
MCYKTNFSAWNKYEIETTNIFDTWFAGVKDSKSKAQIISRFDKVQLGNFGDHKSIIDVPFYESPALNGQLENDSRLKEDLASMVIFDTHMSL